MKGEFMDVLSKVATIDINQDYLNRLIDEIDPGKYKLRKNSNKRLLLTSHSVSKADFKKFCKDNPVSTIYLIETNTNDKVNPFTLQILYNPNFYLSRKFKKTSHQPNSSNSRQFRESDLRQEIAKEKVVVLVGGPGSGKTTSLTKLYDDELIAGNYWIIRINVSKHLKEIQNLDCTNLSIERVVKFLQRIEPKLKDELLKELLETALNVDKEFAKRLLIVFDELDALSHDDDEKKTILLLKFLMDKTSSALWIATTQNCLEKLEQELSVSAIELLPMDYDLNIIFMQNYLRDRVKLTPMQSKFDGAKQSGKLLEKVESCFSADLSYLRGNLSVLIMAMEIFLDYLKHNPVENLDGLQIDNIAGFCERFIHLKLDIYYKSKNKLEKYNQGREMEMLEQQLNDVAELIILKQPFDKILDDDLSLTTGIVRRKGGSLKFIQGFLEDLYVAKTFIYWVCNNMKPISVGEKNKISLETILMMLEESANRKIRIFINFLLQNIDLESDKNKCTYFIIAKIFDECSEKEQYLNKTALHVAIEEKNYQIFRFLFSYSNKELHKYETLLKITDSRNQTLLSYSVINGCFEIFKLLLSEIQRLPPPEQENILRKETENGSILNEAAINGHCEIAELVLKEGEAPLEIQRELLMKKTKNQTALSLAVSKNHLTVVKELLEKSKILLSENDRKFLLTMTYDLNQTILHITVENGSYGVLELLLKHLKPLLNNELHNFFITKKNNDQTILHLAAEKGHLEIVRLLLESEPTSNLREFILVPDKNNETVFHLAIKRNFFSIFYFILEKGNEVLTPQEQQDFRTMASENINNAFSLAVSKNNMAQLKKWFEDGDEQLSLQTQHNLLLMVYDSGKTALNVAVENNYLDLTEYLFEKARKVLNREDLIAFFTSGVNNLFLAEITKNLMLVDLILKEGDKILKDQFAKLIDFMKVSNALNSPSEGIQKLVLKTIQYKN